MHDNCDEHNGSCSHVHEAHREGCDCDSCSGQNWSGQSWVRGYMQDDAAVISAKFTLTADYDTVDAVLKTGLEELAASISDKGGIIGHIKATAEINSVEMFSLTNTEVSVRRSPEQDIVVRVAAIVFFIDLDEAKDLVERIVINRLISM